MTVFLPILGLFLAVAAAADVAQRRVPNLVVAPLAAAGVAAQWVAGGALASVDGLLAACAVTVVLGVAWAKGAIGAGDVKLAAAVAIWLGAGSVVPFLLFTGVAGVPVALAARLSHRVELWRVTRRAIAGGPSASIAVQRETAPVAVAVALGALAVLWGRP
jgi:Flp pilus assembly protein protease CpaA